MKKFLDYRDHFKEFEEIKRLGKIGLPCIIINEGEKIIFDYNDL